MTVLSNHAAALTVVVIVDHAHIAGGQAKVAFDSALGLLRAGHRPIVFAAAGPVDPALAATELEILCLDQTDLVGNPSKAAAALQGIWNFTAARALEKLLAGLPLDRTVVHVHGWAKAISPSIARPIARSGLPAVYTMHEYFLFCPNGGFYNYQEHRACPLTPMSVACLTTNCDSRNYGRKVWRSLRQLVSERVAHLADVFSDFVIISNFQAQIVGRYLPAAARVHRVSNPVSAERLGPKQKPASGDFVFVGRISPEKGPFLFAQAAKLAGAVPVFVGDGPAAAELRARHPEAIVLGWKTPEDVRVLMRAARALVFPSLWYEGQPLTVLEAKAMGTPVIVSDGCAAREEIEHERTGLWFKSGDVEALAGALESAKDDALLESMSRAAYDAYWAHPPTIETHVDKIVEVYRTALGRTVVARAAKQSHLAIVGGAGR
jgi:glycosyltransferase involved in cell wall biosynthesis